MSSLIRTLLFLSFIFSCAISLAQNDKWSLHSLTFQDDPVDLSHLMGEMTTSSLVNFGQHIGLERIFSLHEKLGIIVGGGGGYLNTSFSIERRMDTTFEINDTEVHYLNFYTGLSLSHGFNQDFYSQVNLRVGAMSALFVSKRSISHTSVGNFIKMSVNNSFLINEHETIQLILQPEIVLGYKIPNTRFAIQLGVGLIYAPQELISGSILKSEFVDEEEYFSSYSYSDGLNGRGIAFTISYNL